MAIAVRCDDNGDHKFLFITAKAGLGPEQTAGCALFTDAGLKKYQEFILAPLRIKIYCHSAVILIEALKNIKEKPIDILATLVKVKRIGSHDVSWNVG